MIVDIYAESTTVVVVDNETIATNVGGVSAVVCDDLARS